MKPWSDIQFKHIPVECLHLCRGPHRPQYTHSIGISTFFYYSTNNHIREIRKKTSRFKFDEFHCIGEFHSGVPFGSPYLGDLWNSKLWKSMKTNTLQNHGISLPEIYHQV